MQMYDKYFLYLKPTTTLPPFLFFLRGIEVDYPCLRLLLIAYTTREGEGKNGGLGTRVDLELYLIILTLILVHLC